MHTNMKRSVVFMDHFGDTANEEDHLECVYFAEPVQIDEIKILPNHSSIQLKQRSFLGQTSPKTISNLEIFIRNDEAKRFERLTDKNFTVNGEEILNIVNDKQFKTKQIVIRGTFKTLSLCVYALLSEAQISTPVPITPPLPSKALDTPPISRKEPESKTVIEPLKASPSEIPKATENVDSPRRTSPQATTQPVSSPVIPMEQYVDIDVIFNPWKQKIRQVQNLVFPPRTIEQQRQDHSRSAAFLQMYETLKSTLLPSEETPSQTTHKRVRIMTEMARRIPIEILDTQTKEKVITILDDIVGCITESLRGESGGVNEVSAGLELASAMLNMKGVPFVERFGRDGLSQLYQVFASSKYTSLVKISALNTLKIALNHTIAMEWFVTPPNNKHFVDLNQNISNNSDTASPDNNTAPMDTDNPPTISNMNIINPGDNGYQILLKLMVHFSTRGNIRIIQLCKDILHKAYLYECLQALSASVAGFINKADQHTAHPVVESLNKLVSNLRDNIARSTQPHYDDYIKEKLNHFLRSSWFSRPGDILPFIINYLRSFNVLPLVSTLLKITTNDISLHDCLFGSIRNLVLLLLSCRGGLHYMMTCEPQIIESMIESLLPQDILESVKAGDVRKLDDYNYAPLHLCLEHPDICSPTHLASLLVYHAHSLLELDSEATISKEEKINVVKNLYNMSLHELGKCAVTSTLSHSDGLNCLLSMIDPFLYAEHIPGSQPDFKQSNVAAQYSACLLLYLLQNEHNCSLVVSEGPMIYDIVSKTLSTHMNNELRSRMQQILDWLKPSIALKDNGIDGLVESIKFHLSITEPVVAPLVLAPAANPTPATTTPSAQPSQASDTSAPATGNAAQGTTSAEAPAPAPAPSRLHSLLSRPAIQTLTSAFQLLSSAIQQRNASVIPALYSQDLVSDIRVIVQESTIALIGLEKDETKVANMIRREQQYLRLLIPSLRVLNAIISHLYKADVPVFRNTPLLNSLQKLQTTIVTLPTFQFKQPAVREDSHTNDIKLSAVPVSDASGTEPPRTLPQVVFDELVGLFQTWKWTKVVTSTIETMFHFPRFLIPGMYILSNVLPTSNNNTWGPQQLELLNTLESLSDKLRVIFFSAYFTSSPPLYNAVAQTSCCLLACLSRSINNVYLARKIIIQPLLNTLEGEARNFWKSSDTPGSLARLLNMLLLFMKHPYGKAVLLHTAQTQAQRHQRRGRYEEDDGLLKRVVDIILPLTSCTNKRIAEFAFAILYFMCLGDTPDQVISNTSHNLHSAMKNLPPPDYLQLIVFHLFGCIMNGDLAATSTALCILYAIAKNPVGAYMILSQKIEKQILVQATTQPTIEIESMLKLLTRMNQNWSSDIREIVEHALSFVNTLYQSMITFYTTFGKPIKQESNNSPQQISVYLVKQFLSWDDKDHESHPLCLLLNKIPTDQPELSNLRTQLQSTCEYLTSIHQFDSSHNAATKSKPILDDLYVEFPKPKTAEEILSDINSSTPPAVPFISEEPGVLLEESDFFEVVPPESTLMIGIMKAAQLIEAEAESGLKRQASEESTDQVKRQKSDTPAIVQYVYSNRRDPFRSRKPNTSRPPSMHVDTFVALEKSKHGKPAAATATASAPAASSSASSNTPSQTPRSFSETKTSSSEYTAPREERVVSPTQEPWWDSRGYRDLRDSRDNWDKREREYQPKRWEEKKAPAPNPVNVLKKRDSYDRWEREKWDRSDVYYDTQRPREYYGYLSPRETDLMPMDTGYSKPYYEDRYARDYDTRKYSAFDSRWPEDLSYGGYSSGFRSAASPRGQLYYSSDRNRGINEDPWMYDPMGMQMMGMMGLPMYGNVNNPNIDPQGKVSESIRKE